MINLLVMITTLISLQSAAAPKEFPVANSASAVMQYLANLPKNSIIFIDVDDTLITPVSKTFRRPPYNKLIDDIKKHKDRYANYEQLLSNWRLQRKVMLVDQNWISVLSELAKKYNVYGLTKMDVGKFGNIQSMEKWRYQELRSLGIQFSNNIALPKRSDKGAVFYKGIFITGDNSKGQTIEQYMSYLSAKTIVMIDDRLDHLQDIKQFCNKHAINFIGILFNGIELLEGNQDPAVFAIQKQYLTEHSQWLEDDEAIRKITKK